MRLTKIQREYLEALLDVYLHIDHIIFIVVSYPDGKFKMVSIHWVVTTFIPNILLFGSYDQSDANIINNMVHDDEVKEQLMDYEFLI